MKIHKMTSAKKFLIINMITLILGACQQTPKPTIVPAVETPQSSLHRMNVIGAVEPIYFPPMKTPFAARIDTGAEQSALDADNIKYFERDGEKWVSFTMTNRESGETHRCEKEIDRHINIKRIHLTEKRPLVTMDVKFGKETFTASFSLAQRDKFEYQALVGRNILTGRAIVDTSVSNTLH